MPATRSRARRRSTTSCGARSRPSESSSTPTEGGAVPLGPGRVVPGATDQISEPPAESWRAWIPEFDHLAATYDEAVTDPWLAYEDAWAFVERALRAGLGEPAGRRVVDVGCGTGEYLRRVVELGAVGVGIEPSSGMRAAAARKVPGASVLDGHLLAIPLPDDGADAAIATYVVSHLEPAAQPAAIDEVERVVAADGPVIVVDVPTVAPADMPRVREILLAAGRGEQVAWFERGLGLDAATWRARLETAGRRVVIEPLGALLIGLAGLPAGASRR